MATWVLRMGWGGPVHPTGHMVSQAAAGQRAGSESDSCRRCTGWGEQEGIQEPTAAVAAQTASNQTGAMLLVGCRLAATKQLHHLQEWLPVGHCLKARVARPGCRNRAPAKHSVLQLQHHRHTNRRALCDTQLHWPPGMRSCRPPG